MAQAERQAKQVCAACPVRAECLDYALRVNEPLGVWGGLDPIERRTLLRVVAPDRDPVARPKSWRPNGALRDEMPNND